MVVFSISDEMSDIHLSHAPSRCQKDKHLYFSMKYINALSMTTMMPKNIRLKLYSSDKYLSFLSATGRPWITTKWYCIHIIYHSQAYIAYSTEMTKAEDKSYIELTKDIPIPGIFLSYEVLVCLKNMESSVHLWIPSINRTSVTTQSAGEHFVVSLDKISSEWSNDQMSRIDGLDTSP